MQQLTLKPSVEVYFVREFALLFLFVSFNYASKQYITFLPLHLLEYFL